MIVLKEVFSIQLDHRLSRKTVRKATRRGIATVVNFVGFDEATNQSLEILGDVLDDFLATFAAKITEEVRVIDDYSEGFG